MSTKLIRLTDGTLVEVEAKPNEIQQISSKSAEKVKESIDKLSPIIIDVVKPVVEAWKELNKEMIVETAEVEIGLSFEAEGNIYITRSAATANITIKVSLKPKDKQ